MDIGLVYNWSDAHAKLHFHFQRKKLPALFFDYSKNIVQLLKKFNEASVSESCSSMDSL